MPIKTEVWRIDNGLQKLSFSSMETEAKLESLLAKDVTIIDKSLMVIGRQVPTAYNTFIDLLAIDAKGHLAIIELKRNRTPREVIAQAIDYASWVESLTFEDVTSIFSVYQPSQHFEQVFEERFRIAPPESLNEEHRLVIVASELDNSTERILNYLTKNYSVPINVVFFSYFKDGQNEYVTRTWLLDPVEAEVQAVEKIALRHQLRQEFWTQLLEKAKVLTPNFANKAPSKDNWISAASGKGGIGYAFVIRMDNAQIELYIDRGNPDINKQLFETLLAQRSQIEQTFGKHLDWQKLDAKRACRIRYVIEGAGLLNKEKWPDIQKRMIESMMELQKAVQPVINTL
jgi:hypothetical protein